jgi:flagellin-like protein
MKKFRKSKKALSPVVASIILIAVTVAVSIAVAAWMGALTINFMGTEEVKITNVKFIGGTAINVTLTNTGTTDVTISEAWVNGVQQSGITYSGDATAVIAKNSVKTLQFNCAYDAGSSYNIQVRSTKGTTFPYTANAPS